MGHRCHPPPFLGGTGASLLSTLRLPEPRGAQPCGDGLGRPGKGQRPEQGQGRGPGRGSRRRVLEPRGFAFSREQTLLRTGSSCVPSPGSPATGGLPGGGPLRLPGRKLR